jgi:hypothetical protein
MQQARIAEGDRLPPRRVGLEIKLDADERRKRSGTCFFFGIPRQG